MAIAQDYKDFTLEESRAFHQQFEYSPAIWGKGGEITRYVFLNMSEFWFHTAINRKEPVQELPLAAQDDVANFIVTTELGEIPLKDYVRKSTVDGVVILHKGRIVFEDYPRMFPHERHVYFSVTKTFVSTAIAILEDRGQIEAEMPIETYFKELKGTAWEGIRVIDILDMCSGIDCLETEAGRTDPNACHYQFFREAFGFQPPEKAWDNPVDYLKTTNVQKNPGEVFEYSSVNTIVLSWMVEKVTGLTFSDFMEKEIWQKVGAESDALMITTKNGDAFAAGGVSSNLRDMARYGMLFTPSGRKGKNPVISDDYLEKIQKGGRPELFTLSDFPNFLKDESLSHNTYQWDHVTTDGDFFKAGFGGQGLYISPTRDVVIAFFGTYNENKIKNEMPRIARQLTKSKLFNE